MFISNRSTDDLCETLNYRSAFLIEPFFLFILNFFLGCDYFLWYVTVLTFEVEFWLRQMEELLLRAVRSGIANLFIFLLKPSVRLGRGMPIENW